MKPRDDGPSAISKKPDRSPDLVSERKRALDLRTERDAREQARNGQAVRGQKD